jgi:D-lyxose ketol-isomerase
MQVRTEEGPVPRYLATLFLFPSQLCPRAHPHLHTQDIISRKVFHLLLTVFHQFGLQGQQNPASISHTFSLQEKVTVTSKGVREQENTTHDSIL